MTKKCSAVLVAVLLSLALFSAANRASAHWTYSTFGPISTSPFLFYHTPAPNYATWNYVGWYKGTWENTTWSQAATPNATNWIQAWNYCTNGGYTYDNARLGATGTWSGAPTCESWGGSSAHLNKGACGIAEQ
jgi:hypothetical protein